MDKIELGKWMFEHGLIEHRIEKESKEEQVKATQFGIEVFVILDVLVEKIKLK